MKIKQIVIRNFLSIKDTTLNFSNLNVFVGRNNSGKSNILKAISYAFEAIGLARDGGVRHQINKQLWHRYDINNPIIIKLVLEFNGTEHKRFADLFGSGNEPIELIIEIIEQQQNNENSLLKCSIPAVQNKNNRFQDLITYIYHYFNFIPANRQIAEERLDLVNQDKIYGVNIKKFLHAFSTGELEERERFGLIKSNLKLMDFNFGDLEIYTSNKQNDPHYVDTRFNEGGILMNSNNSGSGLHTSLIIVSNLISSDNNILAIEEPEINLHNNAQRRMFEVIKAQSEKKQIFLTTHSPIFINHEEVFLFKKDNFITNIRKLKNNELKEVLLELGVIKSDILLSNLIVWVEGESDSSILNFWFERECGSLGVSFIPTNGKKKLKSFDLVKKLTIELGIPCFYIIDKDKLAFSEGKQKEKDFASFGVLKILENNTIEDYLLNLNAIKKVFGLPNEEIEEILKQDKSGLEKLELIAEKAKMQYNKIEHGIKLANNIDLLPLEIKSIFEDIKQKLCIIIR